MRRTFLFQLIACGIAYSQTDARAVAGEWHLLDAADDEVNVPQHRMDLRFRNEAGELKGAILSRRDGSEIPLASAEFDGSTLRFKMTAPAGRTQTEMPTMVMSRNGGKFEGQWTDSDGQKMGLKLKLVRAAR